MIGIGKPMVRGAAAALLVCAGCASPIKPALVDLSGPKMRQAAIEVKFQNTGGDPRLEARSLAAEFVLAMQKQAGPASSGALAIVKPPEATHVIAVDATLLSRTTSQPGYWDSCLYQSKDGKCTGGMTPETTDYSRLRLILRVTEKGSGKVVFRSDDQSSRPVMVDDRGIDRAAAGAARAVLQALKDSGLL
jgi:hypothetical protein